MENYDPNLQVLRLFSAPDGVGKRSKDEFLSGFGQPSIITGYTLDDTDRIMNFNNAQNLTESGDMDSLSINVMSGIQSPVKYLTETE